MRRNGSLPHFVIAGARCFSQAVRQQHFGTDDFKAKAPSFAGQELHEAVQTFGVSGGHAVSKVVKNGVAK